MTTNVTGRVKEELGALYGEFRYATDKLVMLIVAGATGEGATWALEPCCRDQQQRGYETLGEKLYTEFLVERHELAKECGILEAKCNERRTLMRANFDGLITRKVLAELEFILQEKLEE